MKFDVLDPCVLYSKLPSESGSGVYVPMLSSVSSVVDSTYTATGCYLDHDYTSPGTYSVVGIAFVEGEPVKVTDETDLVFGQHGSPIAPDITEISIAPSSIVVTVQSDQTPHQLGFFDFSDITYYAESSTENSESATWNRGSGVTNPNAIEYLSAPVLSAGYWHVRVFAENPLGQGKPLYFTQE